MGKVKEAKQLNNNPQNNDNIDDILDILQKRREQDTANSSEDNAATRVDNQAVKQQPVASSASAESKPQESSSAPKQQNPPNVTEKNKAPAESVSAKKETQITKKTEVTNNNATKSNSSNPAKVSTTSSKTSRQTPQFRDSTVVSLDDFDAMTKPVRNKKLVSGKKDKNFFLPGYVKVIIYLAVVISVSLLISFTVINVSNDMFALVKDDNEITINIDENATLDEIAEQLHDNGVIKYPFAYKMYTKMKTDGASHYTGDIVSGEHILNSNMNYDSIISSIFETKYNNSIVRVTIPEGYTILEILNLLEEKKVIDKDGRSKMIAKLNDTSSFEYDFLPEMPETVKNDDGTTSLDTEKVYLLEGYLFPDTYDFYVGENIDSVISKFLTNFNNKFDDSFYARCKEIDMTVDEIITIASIIQAEGNNSSDFYLISNVFHNRIAHPSVLGYTYPLLQSDATSAYAFQGKKKASELTSEEIRNVDSPYNTYTNHGLTPGAICNPGHDAIHAALYPAEYITETDDKGNTTRTSIDYYYFYTATCNGKTYFSKNLDQHNAYVLADVKNEPDELEKLARIYK